MTKILQNFALSLLAVLFVTDLQAQRREDHFLRRTTINRLDLEEKINFAMVRPGNQYADENSGFIYTQGIVDAMIQGLKAGKYLAYDPNDIKQSMSFHELEEKLRYQDNLIGPGSGSQTNWGEEYDGDEFVDDEWEMNEDNGLSEFDEFAGDDFQSLYPEVEGDSENRLPGELELGSYTLVLQFVEDWIFDSKTSSLRFDIRYFQLIWVDPAGTLPDKMMAVFRYDDLKPVLAQTQWPNRFNDAENRSAKEIFELRIFNSFMVDVSGQGMKTLDEAERWRLQMVEKEHNLYSY